VKLGLSGTRQLKARKAHAILNALRHELSTKEIRARGISMSAVRRLLATGQVTRILLKGFERQGEHWQGRNYFLYRTVISGQFSMPFQCTGSFCGRLNIHGDRLHTLCRPCREAKLRHNRTERTRQSNVSRANRTRRVLRYNQRMKLVEMHPWLDRPHGLELFRRIVGWTREDMKEFLPSQLVTV
jgi:hypothetical protein